MRAGQLNEVIQIEKPEIYVDDFGANSTVWKTIIEHTKARVTYNNGNRAIENNEIVFAYEVTFTVRIYHQIKEDMRIIWKNKKYRILSIEESKPLQSLTIRTELINE